MPFFNIVDEVLRINMRLEASIRMHLRVASIKLPRPYTPLGKRQKGIRDVDQHQRWELKFSGVM